MSDERSESLEPGSDDARFAARVAAEYTPEPLDAAGRAAFDARLRERLEAGSRRRGWVPALGVAAAAAIALLLWTWVGSAPESSQTPTLTASAPPQLAVPAETAEAAGTNWEQRILFAEAEPRFAADDDEELPPEYDAIAVAFLAQ